MHSQQNHIQTSRQLNSTHNNQSGKVNYSIPFIINGCVVSLSSNDKEIDEPIKAAKIILLSAYRTKIVVE